MITWARAILRTCIAVVGGAVGAGGVLLLLKVVQPEVLIGIVVTVALICMTILFKEYP